MCFGVGPAVAVGTDAAVKGATDAAAAGGIAADAGAGIGAAADFGLTDALATGASVLGDAAPIADAGIGLEGAGLFDSAAQAAGISPIAAEAIGGAGGGVDPLASAAATATGNTAAGTAGADFVGEGLPAGTMTPGEVAAQSEGLGFSSTPQSATVPGTAVGEVNPASAADLGAELNNTSGLYGVQAAEGALNQGAGAGSSSNLISSIFGGKGISNSSLALGALAALGSGASSLFQRKPNYGVLPGPGQTSATAGPLFNAPLQTTGYVNRTPVSGYTPSTGSFYTYGQQAEPQFFNNNYLSLARGGALNRARMMAHAAPRGAARPAVFDSSRGDSFVRGPGDGQSDSVNARLSSGEYVLTAADVARIGKGSNEAGAKKIDQRRREIASGKVKSPLQHLLRAG